MRQLADGSIPFRKPSEDLPPRAVGQGAEDAIEVRMIGNHLVTNVAQGTAPVKWTALILVSGERVPHLL